MAMFRFFRFGIKAGIAASTVYYTVDQGVWGRGEDSAKLYKTVYQNVAPYLKDSPIEIPELPKVPDLTNLSKNYWNKGVIVTVDFLKNLPEHSSQWSQKGWEMIQQLNQTSQTTPSQVAESN